MSALQLLAAVSAAHVRSSVHLRSAVFATVAPPRKATEESYLAQFERVFAADHVHKPSIALPKPSPALQRQEKTATLIPFSSVAGTLISPSRWAIDWGRLVYFAWAHACGAAALLFMFSWKRLAIHACMYFAAGIGITYSFHRQLSHRSFTSVKWLEYLMAYAGTLSAQGSPTAWVSDHRYHHLQCETALDPHSSYEGLWWSHMGWVLDTELNARRCPRNNVADLEADAFYTHIDRHLPLHLLGFLSLCYAVDGAAGVCWNMLRVCINYHVTWLVNSAAHAWGAQPFVTGDNSRNNWWVGLLAFGEGWHNNHHAFEYSARHGLGHGQLDLTWQLIRLFKRLGLVNNVKLPSEAAMAAKRRPEVA